MRKHKKVDALICEEFPPEKYGTTAKELNKETKKKIKQEKKKENKLLSKLKKKLRKK